MSTAINDLSSPASVLEGMLSIPLPLTLSEISLQISIWDFQFHLAAPLIEVSTAFELGEVIIKAAINSNVIVVLSLTGKMIEDSAEFQTERFSFSLRLAEQRAQALFVGSSIMAMLGLAGKMDIRIPELELGQNVKFDLPLPVICERLQARQTAYRLMVIEQVTGKEFVIPSSFSASDLGAIAFVYHAIVDRTFSWPNTEPFEGSILATEEGRNQLLPLDRTTKLQFDSIPVNRIVLGQLIPLGNATVIIEDAAIQDAEAVHRDLAAHDSHEVKFTLRSLNGCARYEFSEAPRLPDQLWDSNLQALIDLETQLDTRLANRYHALAAATLNGLSEEEKIAITARPELDEESFSLDG